MSGTGRSTVAELQALSGAMREWRRDFHRHPELAFAEHRTAAHVAGLLRGFGIEVREGIAGTGVVGVLRHGSARRAILLRADMDALPLQEKCEHDWRSVSDGVMHACGHDGHMAMLLGAARHLAQTRRFDGTVLLVFQPAEEGEGGARIMVEEGVLDFAPVQYVFGMHNWPGLAAGSFATRAGPLMAAYDTFEITLAGSGAHAAMPHKGTDPVLAGAELVGSLQRAVARGVDPLQHAVLSVTQFHAGDAWNVIPDTAVVRGSVRSLDAGVSDRVQEQVRAISAGIAAAHRVHADVDYRRGYPPTINDREAVEFALAAAAGVSSAVPGDAAPTMASEDFSYFLQQRPGCYMFIGNGPAEPGHSLHGPHYDFNDDILPVGAAYWVALAESLLAGAA